MTIKAKLILLAGLLLVTVVFSPSELPSCGPFFEQAIFTNLYHPVPEFESYTRGQLGVLHPTYWRMYLFVAYRYLSEKPLLSEEREALINAPNSEPGSEWIQSGSFSGSVAQKGWLDARGKITGGGQLPALGIYRKLKEPSWQSYSNCGDAAFLNAARTLEGRIKEFGVGHAGVKSWVAAQDQVFSNCSGGESIPAAADPELPSLLRADRAYQIAAAHFYAEHFDESARLFREIASDKASPWSGISSYLAARSLIRKATIPAKEGQFDREVLGQAEQELKAILQDDSRRSIHSAAGRLMDYVSLRLHPLEQLHTLAMKLQNGQSPTSFRQNLTDLQYLMDRINISTTLAREAARQTSEMVDWILTFQQSGEESLAHALERWRQTEKAAWLVPVIAKIGPAHASTAAVVEAALKLRKGSPAYPTATYHWIRLLLESGKNDEARSALDELLPGLRTMLPKSSLNLFLTQRMRLSRDLDEFLEFAPRFAPGISYDDPGPNAIKKSKKGDEKSILFDRDSVRAFNEGMPLSLLRRAATGKSLPQHLRRQLVCSAWVRAILMSDHGTGRELALELERLFPELKSSLQTYMSAPDAESKQFAASALMLNHPGMSPYLKSGIPLRKQLTGISDIRENWWCGLNTQGDLDSWNLGRYWSSSSPSQGSFKRDIPAEFAAFLTAAERAAFRREWSRLAEVGAAPNLFGRVVLAWAVKHPGDARVPEALHLVVKSTRFGCTDSESWSYSRDAFQMLHKNYPDSNWAKMTKYWYR